MEGSQSKLAVERTSSGVPPSSQQNISGSAGNVSFSQSKSGLPVGSVQTQINNAPSQTTSTSGKKSTGEAGKVSRRSKRSPLVNKHGGDVSGTTTTSSSTSSGSTSTTRPRSHTSEGLQTTSKAVSDGHQSQEEIEAESSLVLTCGSGTNGGPGGNWSGGEEDGHDGAVVDPSRTKVAIDQLQLKIHKIMDLIKTEQNAKEENVNEYLRLSTNADKQQQQRIKSVFERKNQKSTQSISALQRKLENYNKRLKDVETYGVTGHKQAKEVLKDVGQGLKGVVDNIRGAKESIVSKPKEFAHLIKNKFGSADNISNLKQYEDGSVDEGDKQSHTGSGTLPTPARCGESIFYAYTPTSSYKNPSDDDTSSVTSGSVPSGAHSSPRPPLHTGTAPAALSDLQHTTVCHTPQGHTDRASDVPSIDLEPVLRELNYHKDASARLQFSLDSLKTSMVNDHDFFKRALEEERFRYERLEEQINDLTELHQHEVTNIKQELSSMEEKMEYQLEERTRDMQDLLETCQTRITKMELQQQQQQLISMEGIENSNFRALLTKLINVVLALLAVVLVFVSTMANMLGPFLTTRVRILTTICLVAFIIVTWQNWSMVKDVGHHLVDRYHQILPFQ